MVAAWAGAKARIPRNVESTREVCRNAWRPDRPFWSVGSDDYWAIRAGNSPEESRILGIRGQEVKEEKQGGGTLAVVMIKLISRQIPLRTLGLEPETY